MSFYIDFDEGIKNQLPFKIDEIVEKVSLAVLDEENCPYEAEVNFLLTDDAGIQRYNNEFRGLDKSTDVLSFPAIDYEFPADFSHVEENYDSYFNPESGELILGDIVVSQEHVFAQSEEYGHSLLREFAFLIAHSALHLCGYDHETKEEAEIMEHKQQLIMDHLGITRED